MRNDSKTAIFCRKITKIASGLAARPTCMMRLSCTCLFAQHLARSQEFEMGRGLFWRLETTLNHLDPNFDWFSLRLSRFFLPYFRCSPKKKKKVFTENETVIQVFSKKKIKEVFTENNETVFLPASHQVLDHLSSSMGGYFRLLC